MSEYAGKYDGIPEPLPEGAAKAALAVETAYKPSLHGNVGTPYKPGDAQARAIYDPPFQQEWPSKAPAPSTKVPLHLFPPVAMIHTVMVLQEGALKHGGTFNWRDEGGEISRAEYLGKVMRHILAALDGEDLDPEDGRPHEAHAIADLAIIMDAMQAGTCIDDRNPSHCVPALLNPQ